MSGSRASATLCLVGDAGGALADIAGSLGWSVVFQEEVTDVESVAVVVTGLPGVQDCRRQFPHALVVSEEAGEGADLSVDVNADAVLLRQVLDHGEAHWRRNLKVLELVQEVGTRRQRMHQLSEIGVALSSRMQEGDLLVTILSEARRIANCDAGSLYLVDGDDRDRGLMFKLAQNDTIFIPFQEMRLPLTPESLAGYVAISGNDLNIEDVYELPVNRPYRFNRSVDVEINYRTRSMLVLPMRDHRHKVVGVLQFINRLDPLTGEVVPFVEEVAELLRAVASQAAVAIQKNTLINDINQLFESFVQASVKTIEQRDPTTSGHSFRVAETTVALLESLPRSSVARFRDLSFTDEDLREVRYAALLHDFGKIGVRENVLTKVNKLTDDRLEIIRYRVELQKERIRRRAVERELDLLHKGKLPFEQVRRDVRASLAQELAHLDDYYQWVVKANEPSVLDEGDFDHLNRVRDYAYRELDGSLTSLIYEDEMLALSVRRGSLTPQEREEIESHVVHTREFLSVLPWPPELARVPDIAGAHHEKLNGTGYPQGLTEDQIPLPSRVMTVCDIYDALTAMDRPYKAAMPDERAFSILEDEASQGLLDRDLVDIFIQSRAARRGLLQDAG
ncbi:MAG: HD domain-containing phosphohydrolase [Kiritimatiellia bacterium]|jgi:HD-GYP domain-containing protein (c-di-GMP phosphodiesterase class II)|nr:HD domain-containing phosphohydrolase [Pseudomonadales bacterium]MDP6470914.1 HD domain-containing phosphohydrolase [Pseudomonadales bacterium]MDP6825901.1 HD domain-containing phosphohydrolase [Pseudomonadales bacterium]MDP7024559.1 HD domain-containing phosphohydrolase [Kiritimatiellia bacterium]